MRFSSLRLMTYSAHDALLQTTPLILQAAKEMQHSYREPVVLLHPDSNALLSQVQAHLGPLDEARVFHIRGAEYRETLDAFRDGEFKYLVSTANLVHQGVRFEGSGTIVWALDHIHIINDDSELGYAIHSSFLAQVMQMSYRFSQYTRIMLLTPKQKAWDEMVVERMLQKGAQLPRAIPNE